MAQGTYKTGEIIEVTYQAAGATTGLTDVVMEIFDETGAKDIVNFPDVTMTEIASTGRYNGSFTPDVAGKWRVMINSVTKAGKLVKDYDVVPFNIQSIGEAVDTMEADIRGADSDTLKTLSDQIDGLSSGFESAPHIG